MNNSLGCGKNIYQKHVKGIDFICGVANAWGNERLCLNCNLKMRSKWREEDKINYLKGGKN